MIFVSYSWINNAPDENVIGFVNQLREKGYEATCDIMYSQGESAISFPQMMAQNLQSAEKVVVVLNEEYKKKADSFSSGVGTEYRYIITDIQDKKSKYILLALHSFENMSAIIPCFLVGREYIVLDKSDGWDELLRKLTDTPQYLFLPVSPQKVLPAVSENSNVNIGQVNGRQAHRLFCDKNINFSISYYDELGQGPLNQLMIHFTVEDKNSFDSWNALKYNEKCYFLYTNLKKNLVLILGANTYKATIRLRINETYFMLGTIAMCYDDTLEQSKFFFPKELTRYEKSSFEIPYDGQQILK